MISHSFFTEVALYAVLAASAGAILILLTLLLLLRRDTQRKIKAMARSIDQREESLQQTVTALSARIQELQQLSHSIERHGPSANSGESTEACLESPVRPRPQEQRKQVLQMLEGGADAAAIAAHLSMRENEVRLMLKVQNTMRCCISEKS